MNTRKDDSLSIVQKINTILRKDPKSRHASNLAPPHSLFAASQALARLHATSRGQARVAILTGFVVRSSGTCETDGPPGAAALAYLFQKLGWHVELLVVRTASPVVQAAVKQILQQGEETETRACMTNKTQQQHLQQNACSSSQTESQLNQIYLSQQILISVLEDVYSSDLALLKGDELHSRFQALISIEMPGPATDGVCYDMRGNPIDPPRSFPHMRAFFDQIHASPVPILTIGIGDGGNEVGMGTCKQQVQQIVPRGNLIACDITCDHLISCGCSNWGGWGLAAATVVQLVDRQLIQSKDAQSYLFPSHLYIRVCEQMRDCGAVDGVTGDAESLSTDDMHLDFHLSVLSEISSIIMQQDH